MKQKVYSDFYQGKKVLVTGHTGFKGTWLMEILKTLGASLCGYALNPPTSPSLFELTHMDEDIKSVTGDIRDYNHLLEVFKEFEPEIVIHMAAQPLVRESYKNPLLTYETNVMGTANLLECVRNTPSVKSVINVTTDKVYLNREWDRGYVETDVLDGFDPYSNSKSCSELVTHSYSQSFLKDMGIAVSTMRAGNVIGGGDFAKDRIIPDCVRAAFSDKCVVLRNPHSTRPYQHVLEPLFAYLLVAMKQYENIDYAGNYNVGPDDCNNVTTGVLADRFCYHWGEDMCVKIQGDGGPHEAGFLKLDCTLLKQTFLWQPTWTIDETLKRVVDFEKIRKALFDSGADDLVVARELRKCMCAQINEFIHSED